MVAIDGNLGCLQGMNYVAASLLLVMKTEEEAFWMLAVLLENILYHDSYSENLYGCHVEQRVFKDLFKKKCPRFHILSLCSLVDVDIFACLLNLRGIVLAVYSLLVQRTMIFLCVSCKLPSAFLFSLILVCGVYRLATHFDNIDFDVSLVTTEWFLCLFAKSLPSEVCTHLSC